MARHPTFHTLKPGQIFKLVDEQKYEVSVYGKKGASPKRENRTFYLEEWHAVVRGEYESNRLYTILFKKVKQSNGVDESDLKDGEFKMCDYSRDLFDSEPPTSIEIIEDKELRMIVSPEGLRAKLVSVK